MIEMKKENIIYSERPSFATFLITFICVTVIVCTIALTLIFYNGNYTLDIKADDNVVKIVNVTTTNQYNSFNDFPRTYSTSEVIYLKDGSTKLCYRLNQDYGAIKKGDYLCPI
jgi:hypothetical protein